MEINTIFLILDIIGTMAFAVSGAFVAIKVRFDIFGVLVIGCLTAVGGGITRDILIGATPPAVFSKWYILAIAALTSLAVFLIAYINRKKFDETRSKIEYVNNIFDAIGLGAFSVAGTEVAFTNGFSGNPILAVTLGVLTGVGGGVLRDVLTETPPYIFKKHVYALASMSGAIAYYVIRLFTQNNLLPSVVGMALVVGLRMLASKYKWSLPKIKLSEGDKGKKHHRREAAKLQEVNAEAAYSDGTQDRLEK